jgi:hypothetical protein
MGIRAETEAGGTRGAFPTPTVVKAPRMALGAS